MSIPANNLKPIRSKLGVLDGVLDLLKEFDILRRRYGQSYEMFFVDDEGYLNYQQLVNEVDAAIRAGKMSFLDGVDKRKLSFYRNYKPHPQLPALETAQLRLSERYGYSLE